MRKRILSFALCLCMVLTLLPTALAVDGYKTQLTSQLSIASWDSSKGDLESNGWEWDSNSKTLTLDGLDLSVASGIALSTQWFASTTTINIVVNGMNRISSSSGTAVSFASNIDNTPNINITGTGTLEIASGGSNGISALSGCGSLSVTGTTIIASGAGSGQGSAVINCSGKISLTDATITLTTTNTWASGLRTTFNNSEETAITIVNSTVTAAENFFCGICVSDAKPGKISIDDKSAITALISNVTAIPVAGNAGTYARVLGTVTNTRTIVNSTDLPYETFTIESGAVWNYQQTSSLKIAEGTTLINYGTLNKMVGSDGIALSGTLTNHGTINVGPTQNGMIYTNATGCLENTASGSINAATGFDGGATYINNGAVKSQATTWAELASLIKGAPVDAENFTTVTVTANLNDNDGGTQSMEGNRKALITGGDTAKTISMDGYSGNYAVQLKDGAQLRLENLTLQNNGTAPMFFVPNGTLIVGGETTFTTTGNGLHYIHLNRPTIFTETCGQLIVDTDLSDKTLNIYVNQLEAFDETRHEQHVPEGTVVATAGDTVTTLSLSNFRLVQKVYDPGNQAPSMELVEQGNKTEWGQYLALSADGKSVVLKTMYWPVLENDSISATGYTGSKLSDLTVTAAVTDQFGKIIEGIWTWVDSEGHDISDTVPVQGGNTEYLAKFVPNIDARSEFYEIPLTKSVVPTISAKPVVPSGGSTSNTTTSTTTNTDGSTTTTVTNTATGTVTETTKQTDGSTTVVETKKDGTATTTDKAVNGVTTVTKTDANGVATETKVTVPASVTGGAAVTVPTDLGKTDGTVRVTVTTTDGKQQTLVGNYSDGAVDITVPGTATVEIDETVVPLASTVFTDVPAGVWYGDDLQKVMTLGVMNGKSENSFAPGDNMNRQQMCMVLARIAGETPANMAEAVEWAKDAGISDGSNPTGNITRQQFITLMWRAAGSPKGTKDLSGYTDFGKVADYAKEAFAWVVESGIVNGTSATTLSPETSASRAQIAVILSRYLSK